MHARSLYFIGNLFWRLLSAFQRKSLWSGFCFSFLTASLLGAEPPIAQDTTSPNVFGFTSETFDVDEDATNAVVTVEFYPGDRSWSGWVNYSVSNGTARAGEDYAPVNGTLYFSGPGTPVPHIVIPIHNDKLVEGDETIQLFLWNTNAIVTRSTATLVIHDKSLVPQLVISPSANGTISISWPSNFSDFKLEKSTDVFTANWSPVSAPLAISNGSCQVTENCSGSPVFYRLRKISSP